MELRGDLFVEGFKLLKPFGRLVWICTREFVNNVGLRAILYDDSSESVWGWSSGDERVGGKLVKFFFLLIFREFLAVVEMPRCDLFNGLLVILTGPSLEILVGLIDLNIYKRMFSNCFRLILMVWTIVS